MPFIDRDAAGAVVGQYFAQQRPSQEWVDEGHADLAEPIERIRARAREAVKAAARQARHRFVTQDKDAVYLTKIDEANAWLAAGSPDPAPPGAFPHVAAEVGVTADTPDALVSLWAARKAAWTTASAAIERQEMSALNAIAAATTAEAIDDILAGLAWPQPEPES